MCVCLFVCVRLFMCVFGFYFFGCVRMKVYLLVRVSECVCFFGCVCVCLCVCICVCVCDDTSMLKPLTVCTLLF